MLPLKIVMAAGLIAALSFAPVSTEAATVLYELKIAEQELNITGNAVRGMTLNGGIPGPTLRFKEGDVAKIMVHNAMSVETSVHWHGVLLPNDMDGVPYLTYPPIKPGSTFTYTFPVRQSGTYWYHSHTGLQEQRGLYGGIVIEPNRPGPKPDRDYVVVLSDWTDENPRAVIRTLKRGSEWYALAKGSSQSVIGAARLGLLGDYFKRELQRMPAMDIADVAYDRFLANGQPESTLQAEPGETLRLRIIDGSSTTYFYLEFAGGPMTIVAADGQEVEPFEEKRFLIGVAETYDVLVQIPASGAFEFRATAHDGSGYATVWIGDGKRQTAPEVPKSNLYHTMGGLGLKQVFALSPAAAMGMPDSEVEAGRFDRPGMMDMGGRHGTSAMEHRSHTAGMQNHPPRGSGGAPDHGSHMMEPIDHRDHPSETDRPAARDGKKHGTDFRPLASDVSSSHNLAIDGLDPSRPWPPYARLRATQSTAFAVDRPVREIRLTLDGDMERYVWFLNNTPLAESDVIGIRRGEIVRFVMINRTMMHHPMHLHGHFFRVINGQDEFAPLKHTVDVAPMSTTVIEFDANELGDWFFHCHLLYHMESGMARVVHYENFTPDPQTLAVRPELYMDSWYFWGQADALSNMTQGLLKLSNTRNILTGEWEAGWQTVEDTEWETIFTWDRYLNGFFTLFAGVDFLGVNDELENSRVVLGVRYRLPLNIESRTWVDSDGGARIVVGKHFALTPRLSLFGEAQYDTHDLWEGRTGLSFTLTKSVSLMGQWHSDFRWGGGVHVRF